MANEKFQYGIDSIVYKQYYRQKKLLEKFGKDSVRNMYDPEFAFQRSREFMDSMNKVIRGKHDYIEKIIPFSDSLFMITMSRPGYKLMYRDVYFYNRYTNRIVDKREKWLCAPKDTLDRPEDFFTVDLVNSNHYMAYFIGNKIYSLSQYNPKLFKAGTKKDLSEQLYNDIIKNNYKWQILEYTLSSH